MEGFSTPVNKANIPLSVSQLPPLIMVLEKEVAQRIVQKSGPRGKI
jgi:hypothetical protein